MKKKKKKKILNALTMDDPLVTVGSMVKVNFIVFYDIDGAEAKTVLRLADYDGEDEGAWVLLEAL